ncbi:3'-5' exonuclease [Agrobacterium salinitolerans]|uniref:3'-5' exonuclease n=1 Tax=Agrobacterium salinitolerans TaxID=1183413 RepID=A0A4Z1QY40_9HYPH|nr:3'-5' exonuclease [Agrobacterium salinitolerans]UYZ08599.1 3'-5' exonuclease [Agrobacterium salinitolerans]
MDKFIIFDTETSGLFDFTKPADHPDQPRLAQFGAVIVTGLDNEPVRKSLYVRPDGWSMEPGATASNGLTTEFLLKHGVPVKEALDIYEEAILGGHIAIAYNSQFDCKMMRAEFRRAGRPDHFEKTRNTCLMRSAGKLKIKKAGVQKGWPKLSDCCAHFGLTQMKAHDAMGDAEDAYQVFLKMHAAGHLIPPAVHYAKERA